MADIDLDALERAATEAHDFVPMKPGESRTLTTSSMWSLSLDRPMIVASATILSLIALVRAGKENEKKAEVALAASREHASALAAALEPFARYAEAEEGGHDEIRRFLGRPSDLCAFTSVGDAHLLIGDLRRAASVLDAHRAREGVERA